MNKYLHLLERLGLSESERVVYLTLLEHPYLTITDISKRSRYHRPVIYRALDSLIADGLVDKSYLEGKRYFYHVTSPGALRKKLELMNSLAEKLLPEMESLYQKQAEAPILTVKEGVEGIRSIHQDLLDSVPIGGIYYRYSSSRVDYPGHSLYTPEGYSEVQAEKELERVVITNEKNRKKRAENPNRSVVAIPAEFDTFDDNITKVIYTDKVAFIDYDSQIGWVVESERFARYEEKLFRLLEKLLREKNPPR